MYESKEEHGIKNITGCSSAYRRSTYVPDQNIITTVTLCVFE